LGEILGICILASTAILGEAGRALAFACSDGTQGRVSRGHPTLAAILHRRPLLLPAGLSQPDRSGVGPAA